MTYGIGKQTGEDIEINHRLVIAIHQAAKIILAYLDIDLEDVVVVSVICDNADFQKMMPMMMMMAGMNGGAGGRSSAGSSQESEMQKRLKEMQRRQEQLIEDLAKAKNETEYTSALQNPVMQRLNGIERKLELMRKNKLKAKEKPGMPKFLMYMQQNMMNQAMLQTHLNDPDPTLEQFPKIVPVAVDPRKRIMPFSCNPFINFEMNKPASKNKDVVI